MDWISVVTTIICAIIGIFLGWRSGKKAYLKKAESNTQSAQGDENKNKEE